MSSKVDDSSTALLLEVQDFTNTNDNSALGSYLRIGGVPSSIKSTYSDIASTIDVTSQTVADYESKSGDTSAFTRSSGEDLASEVLAFVDDTRHRGKDGGNFNTKTQAQRKTESEALHTKGGWREHTDGNRITSTRGDKVEVIEGNYKLLVLGRHQWNNDAGVGLHYESSGGVSYHYDEVPGQIIDVRRNAADTTWEVIEECNLGHFVARYHGVDKEWHRGGGDMATRVGSLGAWKVKYEGATWSSVKNEHGFESDTDFDKPSDAAHQASAAWPGDSSLPSVREEIFADTFTEKVYCKNLSNQDGTADRPVDQIDATTYATTINELQMFHIYTQQVTSPVIKERWESNFFEIFLAVSAMTVKSGTFWDLRWGIFAMDFNGAIKFHAQLNACIKRVGINLALGLLFDFAYAPPALGYGHVVARVTAGGYYVCEGNKFTFGQVRKSFFGMFQKN